MRASSSTRHPGGPPVSLSVRALVASTDDEWWVALSEALAAGQRLALNSEEFDRTCTHIVRLLKDASLLLENGSAHTACFLTITSLEEVAKVHIGAFRRETVVLPRHKDPLYKHAAKHRLAASPTIAMGSRLQAAIGENRMLELIKLAREGGLVPLREACLYAEERDGKLQIPTSQVSTEFARDLLLFTIEAFDDALVGFTNHSYVLGNETDELFARWTAP